jgi:TPR repeat protein
VKRALLIAALSIFPAAAAVAGTQQGFDAFRTGQYDEALKELRPAAKSGDADAQFLLGRMHMAGLGVKKDDNAAVAYYKSAAEGGSVEAAHEYGTALVSGTGVEQDLPEGLKWLYVAEQGGVNKARIYLDRFIRVVPRQTVIRARMDARAWRAEFAKKQNQK